jgi:hypothetical protein
VVLVLFLEVLGTQQQAFPPEYLAVHERLRCGPVKYANIACRSALLH